MLAECITPHCLHVLIHSVGEGLRNYFKFWFYTCYKSVPKQLLVGEFRSSDSVEEINGAIDFLMALMSYGSTMNI